MKRYELLHPSQYRGEKRVWEERVGRSLGKLKRKPERGREGLGFGDGGKN